jgi:hypothetical protein
VICLAVQTEPDPDHREKFFEFFATLVQVGWHHHCIGNNSFLLRFDKLDPLSNILDPVTVWTLSVTAWTLSVIVRTLQRFAVVDRSPGHAITLINWANKSLKSWPRDLHHVACYWRGLLSKQVQTLLERLNHVAWFLPPIGWGKARDLLAMHRKNTVHSGVIESCNNNEYLNFVQPQLCSTSILLSSTRKSKFKISKLVIRFWPISVGS